VNGATLASQEAHCSSGKLPLGGGWAVAANQSAFNPHESAPSGAAGETGWYVSGTSTASVNVFVWVVCANAS
jgi:hypothetical protein